MVSLVRKSQSCRHRIENKQKISGFYYRLSFGRHLNSSFQRFHLFFSIWQTNWQTLAKNWQISGTEDLTALFQNTMFTQFTVKSTSSDIDYS